MIKKEKTGLKKSKNLFKFSLIIGGFFLFFPSFIQASLADDLSGKILLDVERNGEAWYVYPMEGRRYYLGRPADAFAVMRELGLGISEEDFKKIPEPDEEAGDLSLARKLSGMIILQTEKNGEAWYIYPKNLKKYYLGRPADAFAIMRKLGLGISRENLARIHKPGLQEAIDEYSSYSHRKIQTFVGEFSIEQVEIDLDDPELQIITTTAHPVPETAQKGQNFGAKSLTEHIFETEKEEDVFAGLNGSYFCSYANCGGGNYYYFPVFDSREKKMINEDQLKYWTTGPLMIFDENNKFYYFKDSRDFGSVENFENFYKTKIQAGIGNKPRLVEDFQNVLIDWELDDKQKNQKLSRNAIAYKDNKIYLFVVREATVPDLAEIMKYLKMEYALNLDGGYSSALYYNGEYMIGPGRDIPNAILFGKK